jgi:hypothetical protein
MAKLLAATAGSPRAAQQFVSAIAGTMPPGEFFSEQNVARIMAGTA